MRLTCPNCNAQYEIDDGLIPATGRDVQCSNCGHAWFQNPPGRTTVHPDALSTEEHPVSRGRPAVPAQDTAEPEAPPQRPRRPIDPSALDVLREEAERENRARKAEASAVETQPELGLPETRSDLAAGAAAGQTRSKRDRLPDIEEINSTLSATSAPRGKSSGEAAKLPPTRQERSRGFRLGFSIVLILATFALLAYSQAAFIAERFPQAAPMLESYVEAVNIARFRLDDLINRGMAKLAELLRN